MFIRNCPDFNTYIPKEFNKTERYLSFNETLKKIYFLVKNRSDNNEYISYDDYKIIMDLLCNYYSFIGKENYKYDLFSYLKLHKPEEIPEYNDFVDAHISGCYYYNKNSIAIINENAYDNCENINSIHLLNLRALHTFFHEFTHCKQNFLVKNNWPANIQDPYFGIQYILYWLGNYIVFDESSSYWLNHNAVPDERMANIDAANLIINMINSFEDNKFNKELYLSYFNEQLYNYYLHGYNHDLGDSRVEYPIQRFYRNFKPLIFKEELKKYIKELNSSYEVTDIMKMYLGLEIDYNTYNNSIKRANDYTRKKNKLMKKLNK